MSKPVTTIAAALLLPALFMVLFFFVHDYANETTGNLNQGIVTRLQEIHQRHAKSFVRAIAEQLTAFKGVAAVLNDKSMEEADRVLVSLGPVLRAQGVRRFSLVDLDGQGTDLDGARVDHSRTPAFLRAKAGDVGFSVREDKPQNRCLIMAVPVRRNGIVAAVLDRKSTRLNSSHSQQSRMPSSA